MKLFDYIASVDLHIPLPNAFRVSPFDSLLKIIISVLQTLSCTVTSALGTYGRIKDL
jgi:hypothetical protein